MSIAILLYAPNLRGYAPKVSGVAKTNAKVTVSQQGRGATSGYFTHDGDMAQLIANASY
nr:hypothetical protein SYMBAF_190085 [Serratia symbiotica]